MSSAINKLIDEACGYTPEVARASRKKRDDDKRLAAKVLEIWDAADAWYDDPATNTPRLRAAIEAMREEGSPTP